MATVTIPFPSTESLLGPELARAASPPKITIKSPTRKPPGFKKHSTQSKTLNGVAKPKQTKSRNGCHTCKEKRLKCDETKPKCEQCQKRNVTCGGYNRIFQWRPEEKATFRTGPSPKSKKRPSVVRDDVPSPTNPAESDRSRPAPPYPVERSIPSHTQTLSPEHALLDQQEDAIADYQLRMETKSLSLDARIPQCLPEEAVCILSGDQEEEYIDDEFESVTAMTTRSALGFEGSSAFEEALLHTSDLYFPSDWHGPLVLSSQDHEMFDRFVDDADDDQEMIHEEGILSSRWPNAYPSPSPSASSSFTKSPILALATKEPIFNPFSTEMLITRFASETCGILSIKDGYDENPWRTMLLPMSFEVPALHHAILCLSAFHASRRDKRFRITGLNHMQQSIRHLSNELCTMRKDTALATTLVLAFSESWDEETSTGFRHLKAARTFVTQAIAVHKGNADFEEMERLKFLRNTWVYVDVIARITALECDDLENMDALFAPVYGPDSRRAELDPLMGCAWELFPLLGKVAILVREIRKTASSSPRTVSKAAALKVDILKWRAPTDLHVPQDESIEIAHTLSTAEAYRWSALLFLYQAVPMVATESPALLAEKILCNLVSVPLASRVTIIQIFPLLVAGCEVVNEDNRLLVKERWESMIQRMAIGNLDRCSDVVHEVWTRRDQMSRLVEENEGPILMQDGGADEHPFLTSRRSASSPTSPRPNVVRPSQLYRQSSEPNFEIDKSRTVRGYAHWLTVMEDWNWAVLLG